MKLVTFRVEEAGNSVEHVGAVIGVTPKVVGLQGAARAVDAAEYPFFTSMIEFLRSYDEAVAKAEQLLEAHSKEFSADYCYDELDVELLSPVPCPESLRDFMVFEDHIINCIRTALLKKLGPFDRWLESKVGRKYTLAGFLNRGWHNQPVYYKGNRFGVVGPNTTVHAPKGCKVFDYELEWGVIICREGRDIPVEEAHKYIGGYVLFNDFSARDIQMAEMKGRLGPAKGKDFDTGSVIGPYLVTPDGIPDPKNVELRAEINGVEVSRGNSGDMNWSFEELISYVSQSETIYPGECIGSGTCSGPRGSGCGLETMSFLKNGDQVVLKGDGLGELSNTVAIGL